MPGSTTPIWLRRLAVWTPTVFLGLLFVLQGVIKLAPSSPWPEMFARWGFPPGFHLVVGLVELIGGLALFVPRTAGYAAVTLAVVMCGAMGTHLVHGELPNFAFTGVVAAIFAGLAWARLPGRRRRAEPRSA